MMKFSMFYKIHHTLFLYMACVGEVSERYLVKQGRNEKIFKKHKTIVTCVSTLALSTMVRASAINPLIAQPLIENQIFFNYYFTNIYSG